MLPQIPSEAPIPGNEWAKGLIDDSFDFVGRGTKARSEVAHGESRGFGEDAEDLISKCQGDSLLRRKPMLRERSEEMPRANKPTGGPTLRSDTARGECLPDMPKRGRNIDRLPLALVIVRGRPSLMPHLLSPDPLDATTLF